jgi:hypothetical protein
MWQTILLLSGLFLIKNLLFFYFFHHFYLIISFDLIGLSIGSSYLSWSYILEWLLIGWVGLPDELQFLANDYFSFNPWAPTISWLIIYGIFNIYNLIINKLNKNKFIEMNLKFMMINYLPISLWNLHRIIDIGSDSFWPLFSNLMLFNTMAFGLLSLIFYFTYGPHLRYYREQFYFLISDFHPKFKWFNLFTFIFKLCIVTFILYHHYFKNSDYYIIIGLTLGLLIWFLCMKQSNFFGAYKNNWHNINFVISLIFALIILCIAQVENFYQLNGLFITKIIAFISMISILMYNIYRQNKIKKSNESNEIIDNRDIQENLLTVSINS